jgi:hypothetical protein
MAAQFVSAEHSLGALLVVGLMDAQNWWMRF